MGLLPEHDLANTLWYKVAVNLIGPWTALTCIDTTTNFVELVLGNLKILGLLNTKDWHKSSMTMAANSQDMPLPMFCMFWESRKFQ